jgi:hypothetical protein
MSGKGSRHYREPRDRFNASVTTQDPSKCWVWTAGRRHGYGVIWNGSRAEPAHRWAWKNIRNAPVTHGLVLDHLCRNTLCVNPWHLSEVTHAENILAGVGTAARNARRSACRRCGGTDYRFARNVDRLGKPILSRRCYPCARKYQNAYQKAVAARRRLGSDTLPSGALRTVATPQVGGP